MSRVADRRYRVRFAIQGATEVNDSTVDFILNVADLSAIPVIAGSFVHPLDGATEMRPVTIEAVDYAGALIDAFAANGHWVALGRVVDVQWQDSADDPISDAWTTYGTGRCSGLDELDGPGKFKVELSDETWVSRKGEIFNIADTTQLWPAGVRWPWRGFDAAPAGSGTVVGNTGSMYQINVSGSGAAGTILHDRCTVTSDLVRFVNNDFIAPSLRSSTAVNFQTLRVSFDGIEYEVNGFGSIAGASISTLEAAESSGSLSFTVWVYWKGIPFVVPSGTADVFLYSVGEPSDSLPLHLGTESSHLWGYPLPSTSGFPTRGGYLHVADLSRRFFDELGMRYNAANLTALEADLSLPLLAPYILSVPGDPQKWMQQEVWGPNLLLALRDVDGRMKIADLRPPSVNQDLSGFPIFTVANSKTHRWRLVGRDAVNSLNWSYEEYHDGGLGPILPKYFPGPPAVSSVLFGVPINVKPGDTVEGPRLDLLARRTNFFGPFEDPYFEFIGRREKTFSASSPLEPLDLSIGANMIRVISAIATGRGNLFDAVGIATYSQYLLDIYQYGPMLGTCECSGTLAETIEEGDYAIVDCGSVKIANPFTAARFGKVLVLILSVTRYPAHAEIEYLIVRPALLFACPDPDDPRFVAAQSVRTRSHRSGCGLASRSR